MREQRKSILCLISATVFTFICMCLCEFIELNKRIYMISGHRNFWFNIFCGLFTGSILGLIVAIISFKSKKEEAILELYKTLLVVKSYLNNFKGVMEISDASMNKLYIDRYETWYNGIMDTNESMVQFNDLLLYSGKRKKKILIEISDYCNSLYREINSLAQQVDLHKNQSNIDNTWIIGQKKHILQTLNLLGKLEYIILQLAKEYKIKVIHYS